MMGFKKVFSTYEIMYCVSSKYINGLVLQWGTQSMERNVCVTICSLWLLVSGGQCSWLVWDWPLSIWGRWVVVSQCCTLPLGSRLFLQGSYRFHTNEARTAAASQSVLSSGHFPGFPAWDDSSGKVCSVSGQCWWVQPCVVSTGFGAEAYWGMQDWLLRPSSHYLFVSGVTTGPPAQGHKTLRSHRGEAVPKCPQQDISCSGPHCLPRAARREQVADAMGILTSLVISLASQCSRCAPGTLLCFPLMFLTCISSRLVVLLSKRVRDREGAETSV